MRKSIARVLQPDLPHRHPDRIQLTGHIYLTGAGERITADHRLPGSNIFVHTIWNLIFSFYPLRGAVILPPLRGADDKYFIVRAQQGPTPFPFRDDGIIHGNGYPIRLLDLQ